MKKERNKCWLNLISKKNCLLFFFEPSKNSLLHQLSQFWNECSEKLQSLNSFLVAQSTEKKRLKSFCDLHRAPHLKIRKQQRNKLERTEALSLS